MFGFISFFHIVWNNFMYLTLESKYSFTHISILTLVLNSTSDPAHPPSFAERAGRSAAQSPECEPGSDAGAAAEGATEQ